MCCASVSVSSRPLYLAVFLIAAGTALSNYSFDRSLSAPNAPSLPGGVGDQVGRNGYRFRPADGTDLPSPYPGRPSGTHLASSLPSLICRAIRETGQSAPIHTFDLMMAGATFQL